MNRLPTAKRAAILTMLIDGTSMRTVSRLAEVSINTVTKLLNDVGRAAEAYHEEHVRRLPGRRRIECKQTWAFGYELPTQGDLRPRGTGNTWTFTAIDADSKLIVSCLAGVQSRQTTAAFMADLRRRLTESPKLSTDGLQGYRSGDPAPASDEGQSSMIPSIPPGPAERRLEKHVAMINLYALHYNFCHVHAELQATPAMEAGLDEVVRDAEWIVALVDARAAKPNRPKTYRKRVASSKRHTP